MKIVFNFVSVDPEACEKVGNFFHSVTGFNSTSKQHPYITVRTEVGAEGAITECEKERAHAIRAAIDYLIPEDWGVFSEFTAGVKSE